jgi:hypothetical protein
VRVSFHRGRGHEYDALASRPDGVVVRLTGGSYNRFEPPLPHDIAHLGVHPRLHPLRRLRVRQPDRAI